MSPEYAAFLASKARQAPATGLVRTDDLHPALKPFQRDILRWALRRGRAAMFEGTGLGKTLQELVWADIVAKHCDVPVLILTPLAVAYQTIAEAEKFGIEGVAYAGDGGAVSSRIVVTNYDRLEKFDMTRFAGVVLDESSIIKSHDSATRAELTEACRGMQWKLCATATPAPNDFVELGTHAEFLDVLSEKEMLAMFFVHDGSVRAHGNSEWRLKRHAEDAFWRWLATWAVMIRHPADLGYVEPGYDLPPLNRHQVTVKIPYAPGSETLFPMAARTMRERLTAKRDSMAQRVAAAAAIVNAAPDRPWLVWCNLNAEADALVAAIPGAVQVRGSDTTRDKTYRLLGFCRGTPRVLVTKPSIAGWGMNFQHCADMVFVGLNDSFEQLFQAIRRCWRFGQTQPVNVHLIASELEGAVVANLVAKERDYEAMANAMAAHMREITKAEIGGNAAAVLSADASAPMELPAWMQ